jgi:hypothetical protein
MQIFSLYRPVPELGACYECKFIEWHGRLNVRCKKLRKLKDDENGECRQRPPSPIADVARPASEPSVL